MSQPTLTERLGIVGTGAIARGVARVAAPVGDVVMWARSDGSADQAREALGNNGTRVETDFDALADRTYVVESIVEDMEVKQNLLPRLANVLDHDTVVASTTSSLSISELAEAYQRPGRFAGLHFFNPVHKMKLVELAFPGDATDETRRRTRELCEQLDKTPVEVPDAPGFVVNRLLFPYLFDAVRLLEAHDLDPETVDSCMQLGAGHPMGPLRLLDLVGLDVSSSIGDQLGIETPTRMRELIAAGRLGRKSGSGFYDYE